MTLVVHKRERHDVYVGRPSKWGNPFRIGPNFSRKEAIARYRYWLMNERPDLMAALPELRGKVLACWCEPMPCHADVLAELANGPRTLGLTDDDYGRGSTAAPTTTKDAPNDARSVKQDGGASQ